MANQCLTPVHNYTMDKAGRNKSRQELSGNALFLTFSVYWLQTVTMFCRLVEQKWMPQSQRNLLRNSQSASCPQTNPSWLYNFPSLAFLSPAKDNNLLQIKAFLSSTERQQPPANKVFLEVRWTAYRKWVRRQSDQVVACRIVRQTHWCRLSNGHF